MNKHNLTPEHLAELLAKARAKREPTITKPEPTILEINPQISTDQLETTDRYGNAITYNEKQKQFVTLASSGKDCILLGAAGTGKTTCMQGTVRTLIQTGIAGILDAQNHSYLSSGTPGIVIVAFTRRAVANIRRSMPEDMKGNCITIHKLLEYFPEKSTVVDEEGNEKTVMHFVPKRHQGNPLPPSIHTIIFEESSMVGNDLYNQVREAMPHSHQEIFLGDIQQLPPVFGSAILGFKMLELPTIELTEVYRQALESPIIRLAHRVLSGKGIPAKEFPEWNTPNKLTIHPWKKKLHQDIALLTAAKFFTAGIDKELYNPEEDMILIPFNKSFGTDELNKHIALHLTRKRKSPVYEIIVGFEKMYLSPGDKVLYEKEDAFVLEIKPNPKYLGKAPQPHSQTLDYWGYNSEVQKTQDEMSEDDVDFLLDQVVTSEDADMKKTASHIVVVKMVDSGEEIPLESTGEVKSLLLSYALTIHKSQGSEFRKVFLVMHQSHATMNQRELLYTGITRAKEELYIICEPETLVNGIASQRIKGNTLQEKAQYFKGKLEKFG